MFSVLPSNTQFKKMRQCHCRPVVIRINKFPLVTWSITIFLSLHCPFFTRGIQDALLLYRRLQGQHFTQFYPSTFLLLQLQLYGQFICMRFFGTTQNEPADVAALFRYSSIIHAPRREGICIRVSTCSRAQAKIQENQSGVWIESWFESESRLFGLCTALLEGPYAYADVIAFLKHHP